MASYSWQDPKATQLNVVLAGASDASQSVLIQNWVTGRHIMDYTRQGHVHHQIQEDYMGSRYRLGVFSLGDWTNADDARYLLQSADAVVLVYERKESSDTRYDLTKQWVPRVRECADDSTACFVVENNCLGRRSAGEQDIPLDFPVQYIFDSLPASTSQFVRHFEMDKMDTYSAFLRRLFKAAKKSHSTKRRREACGGCIIL